MSNFTMARWKPEGVQLVELWNVPLRGTSLYRLLGAERVRELRVQGRDEAAIDQELAGVLKEALELVRARVPAFEWVALSGGLIARPGLLGALKDGGTAEWVASTSPEFVGAREKRLVIDLGQTSLKLSLGSARLVSHRPLDLLPIHRAEDGQPSSEVAREQGSRLLVIAASVIGSFVAANRALPLEEIVLAVPCELDDSGVAGRCTYPGLDRAWPERLIARVLGSRPASKLGGAAVLPVRLVNDAEWAAHVARGEGDGRCGVSLTLGFGPGAAWFYARGS